MYSLIYDEGAGTILLSNMHTLLDFSLANNLFNEKTIIRIDVKAEIIL